MIVSQENIQKVVDTIIELYGQLKDNLTVRRGEVTLVRAGSNTSPTIDVYLGSRLVINLEGLIIRRANNLHCKVTSLHDTIYKLFLNLIEGSCGYLADELIEKHSKTGIAEVGTITLTSTKPNDIGIVIHQLTQDQEVIFTASNANKRTPVPYVVLKEQALQAIRMEVMAGKIKVDV